MPRYQLSVHAQKLPKPSLFRSSPNPYAVVTVSGGPRDGTEIGRTETLERCTDPDWAAVLFVETDASVFLPLRVVLWDDRGGRDDELLGRAQFEATEIAQSPGHIQTKDLDGRGGKVSASMEESPKGTSKGTFTVQLRGLDICNVEPGLFGLGRSDPFYEISKKNMDHSAGVVRWNVVYRSDHKDTILNPYWNPVSLGTEALCYCDLTWPIRIRILDWNKNGKHEEIGQFETSVEALMGRVAVRGNADREAAFGLFREGKSKIKGLVVVLKADLILD